MRNNERSLRRQALRRKLQGRRSQYYPPPSQVPHGDVHVYTDGAATTKLGSRRAGCGVWFADKSNFNISTSLPGSRQTSNRAELTAVILAMRKATQWPTFHRRVTVFSDSSYCVEGINKWMARWKTEGWSRAGQPIRNQDLWKLMDRVLAEYQVHGYEYDIKKVPAHVGIYGNERADRLAAAAVKRAHRNCNLSREERDERVLENMADSIVARLISLV